MVISVIYIYIYIALEASIRGYFLVLVVDVCLLMLISKCSG